MQVKQAVFITSAVKPAGYPPADRPEIAFAGRSNVGKSTLLNALVGMRKLAKVSQKPGKTRLINFFDVDERFYLVDLPGYGWAKVSREERKSWQKITETYLQKRKTLRCVVVLVDLRRGLGELDVTLLEYLETIGVPALVVFTKADKMKGNQLRRQIQQIADQLGVEKNELLISSALKKQGVKEIWSRLEAILADH